MRRARPPGYRPHRVPALRRSPAHRHGANLEQSKRQCKKLETLFDHEDGACARTNTDRFQAVREAIALLVELAERPLDVGLRTGVVAACRAGGTLKKPLRFATAIFV